MSTRPQMGSRVEVTMIRGGAYRGSIHRGGEPVTKVGRVTHLETYSWGRTDVWVDFDDGDMQVVGGNYFDDDPEPGFPVHSATVLAD